MSYTGRECPEGQHAPQARGVEVNVYYDDDRADAQADAGPGLRPGRGRGDQLDEAEGRGRLGPPRQVEPPDVEGARVGAVAAGPRGPPEPAGLGLAEELDRFVLVRDLLRRDMVSSWMEDHAAEEGRPTVLADGPYRSGNRN
jgi:hypothetical protein